jgi:hypothetical protein
MAVTTKTYDGAMNDKRTLGYALLACLLAIAVLPAPVASYTVTHLNVTLLLNRNTSAQVTELLTVELSNSSVSQYLTNRVALNLTLSDWQALIGPLLVQHVINPSTSVHNFKLLPGSVMSSNGINTAYILMGYTVSNVTSMNQTAPRTFVYDFNSNVFNFEHGASGQVLNPNTTLTIVLPKGSVIESVYPLPDYPPSAFTSNYKNTTTISWLYSEPLSKFNLTFVIMENIQTEVTNFFADIYHVLGAFTYVIIAIVVLLVFLYAYLRVR